MSLGNFPDPNAWPQELGASCRNSDLLHAFAHARFTRWVESRRPAKLRRRPCTAPGGGALRPCSGLRRRSRQGSQAATPPRAARPGRPGAAAPGRLLPRLPRHRGRRRPGGAPTSTTAHASWLDRSATCRQGRRSNGMMVKLPLRPSARSRFPREVRRRRSGTVTAPDVVALNPETTQTHASFPPLDPAPRRPRAGGPRRSRRRALRLGRGCLAGKTGHIVVPFRPAAAPTFRAVAVRGDDQNPANSSSSTTKGGAGGTVGAGIAARRADGYTFFMGAVHHTIAPSMYPTSSTTTSRPTSCPSADLQRAAGDRGEPAARPPTTCPACRPHPQEPRQAELRFGRQRHLAPPCRRAVSSCRPRPSSPTSCTAARARRCRT